MFLHAVPDDIEYHGSTDNYPVKKSRNRNIRMDDTILPGCAIDEIKELGILLKPKSLTQEEISLEVQSCITNMVLECRIATETSPGEPLKFVMQEVVATEDITRYIMKKCQDVQAT